MDSSKKQSSVKSRIYYDDGSVFTGNAIKAMPYGIICIVIPDKIVGRYILHSKDFYIHFVNGEWLGVDWFGLLDNFLHRAKDIDATLAGRTVGNQTYRRIFNQAVEDADKQGWLKGERRG
jgi:hypothetical protein